MKDTEKLIKVWNELIDKQSDALREQLCDLDISALSACMGDCYESFHEVFFDLLEKINNAAPDNFDLIHECVVDMYWQLNHIKDHITNAEKGFTALMNLLAEKAESKERWEFG